MPRTQARSGSPTARSRGSCRGAASVEAEAHYSERVYPGLVWMSLHFAEQKVNWLTHDVGDPLIGTPEYKVSAVRVEPIVGCAPERSASRGSTSSRASRRRRSSTRRCRRARSSSPTTRPRDAAGSVAAGRRRPEPRSSARCCSSRRPSETHPSSRSSRGVAVADTLERETGLAVQLKWPNDVMLRRGEGRRDASRRCATARSCSASA